MCHNIIVLLLVPADGIPDSGLSSSGKIKFSMRHSGFWELYVKFFNLRKLVTVKQSKQTENTCDKLL